MLTSALFAGLFALTALFSPVNWTNCDDFSDSPVALFAGEACSSEQATVQVTNPGQIDMTPLEGQLGSVFVQADSGMSVKLAQHADGTGHWTCVSGSKWVLASDPWEHGEGNMTEVLFAEMFLTDNCHPGPEPQPWTNCNDYAESSVAVFAGDACNPTSPSIPVSEIGQVDLSPLGGQMGSVFFRAEITGSLKLAQHADGTGNWSCVKGSKWVLSSDPWEHGEGNMTEVLFAEMFATDNCEPEQVPQPWNNCDDYAESSVAVFAGDACSPVQASIPISQVGPVDLTPLSGIMGSVYFRAEITGSLKLAQNADGSGSWSCVKGSKWVLASDPWEHGEGNMTTVLYAEMFDTDNCAPEQEPQPWTNCDDYTEAIVGLFAGDACSPIQASMPITATSGLIDLTTLDGELKSIFVKPGANRSLSLAENADGTGRTSCIRDTKWVLSTDQWENGGGNMADIRYAKIHQNRECNDMHFLPMVVSQWD